MRKVGYWWLHRETKYMSLHAEKARRETVSEKLANVKPHNHLSLDLCGHTLWLFNDSDAEIYISRKTAFLESC